MTKTTTAVPGLTKWSLSNASVKKPPSAEGAECWLCREVGRPGSKLK